MSIQFQPLFDIQLIHDYYTRHEKRCPDFDIVPAGDCVLLMKNLQILYKNFSNRFLTVINADKNVNETPPPTFKIKPFLNFPEDLVFRYYLVLKNPHFLNFTSIGLQQSRRFYFSNISNNNTIGNLALSNPFSSFSPDKMYLPGNLVKGADNNLYEAIRLGDNTPEAKDINNTKYWQKVPADGSYVSNSDEVVITGSSFNYILQTPANNITVKIFGLNKTDNDLPYDKLLETVVLSFTQNQSAINIDLSKHKPGKYRMVVNTDAQTWIYLDPQAVKKNIFGIIELHHFPKVPAPFKLLAAGNLIRVPEPIFTIWFKNRAVTWKYISQSGLEISVKEDNNSPAFNFVPATGLSVSSEQAIPLTETPKRLKMTVNLGNGNTNAEFKNLKNPEVGNIVIEKEGNTGFYVGNMYVKPKRETS